MGSNMNLDRFIIFTKLVECSLQVTLIFVSGILMRKMAHQIIQTVQSASLHLTKQSCGV